MEISPHIAVIYGPTASGKSAFAMNVAEQIPAVIINADAMQCYAPLRTITARPTKEDEAQHPHALYGIWDAHTHGQVAMWLDAAITAIRTAWENGRLPVVVGGTGMYLQALMQGLNYVPDIPNPVQEATRALSSEECFTALSKEDSVMAARLTPGDSQRVERALHVIRATGKSLAEWQGQPLVPPLPNARFHLAKLTIDRAALYDRINTRFDAMMQQGALKEVRLFLQQHPDARAPIYKAHGVPELRRYLAQEITLEEAINKAKQHTRNYAKRQETFARGQLADAPKFAPDDARAFAQKIQSLWSA